MDLRSDLSTACELLISSNCNTCSKVYQLLNRHLGGSKQSNHNQTPINIDFVPFLEDDMALWDDIYELKLLSEKMQDVIDGKDDGPILTPVKPKRRKVAETTIEEDDDGDDDDNGELYLPKPAANRVTEDQIIKHRESLMQSFSNDLYKDLRLKCKKNNLNANGKKTELIERLAEKTLISEYGSPRMRNSYQTAMNTPLPISKKNEPKLIKGEPMSLQSHSSTTSLRSTTSSVKSTTSSSSTLNKKPTRSRMRSPSPSAQPKSLPRTPSFKSRLKETMSSGFASPRPWSKTPSKSRLGMMSRTPSKAELEEKEADREKKMKERKAAKEEEVARRRAENERHAEKIRQKKLALEADKKSKKGEKVFTLTGKDKGKKNGLKEKAAAKMKAQQKLQEAQRRVEEEERRQQHDQRQEEERRRQREEQERRQREVEEDQQRQAAMAKTPVRPVPVSDAYEMTPQGEDKWALNPSSMNNYNIDDLDSGDETDDDENPRKKIPTWANMKSTLFKSSTQRQYQSRASPINDIFVTINPNRDVDLTELFDSMASLHAQKRYRKPRNSSGVWNGPMLQPRPLLDRTLNLDQSVYPIN